MRAWLWATLVALLAAPVAAPSTPASETFSTQLVDASREGSEPTLWLAPDARIFVAGMVAGGGAANTWRNTSGGSGYEYIGSPEGGADATIGGVESGKPVHVGIGGNMLRFSVLVNGTWEEKASSAGDRPYLTTYNGRVYAVYRADPDSPKLRLRESTDGGETWSAEKIIAENVEGSATNLFVIKPSGQPAEFNVMFFKQSGGQLIWHRVHSTDPFAPGTWAVESTGKVSYGARSPAAAVDDAGRIYLIWHAIRSEERLNGTYFTYRDANQQWRGTYILNASNNVTWSAGIVAGASGKSGAAWYDRGHSTFFVLYRSITIGSDELPTLGNSVIVGDTFFEGNSQGNMPDIGMDILNVTAKPDGSVLLVYACAGKLLNPNCGAPSLDPDSPKWYPVVATQTGGPKLR